MMWPHVLARQDSAVLVLQTHRPPRAKTRSGGNNRRGRTEAREERRARARESGETGEGGERGGGAAGRRRERGSGGRAGVRVGGGWRGPPGWRRGAGWRRGGGVGMGGGGSRGASKLAKSREAERASERASEAGQTQGRRGGEERSPKAGFLQVQRRGRAGSSEGEVTPRRCVISPSPEKGEVVWISSSVVCERVWGGEMGVVVMRNAQVQEMHAHKSRSTKAEKRKRCDGGWWYRRRCLIHRRPRRRDQKRRKDRTSPPSTARGVRERRRAEKARCNRSRTSRTRERRVEERGGRLAFDEGGGCLSRRQIVKTKPESQWIVITRPLYHLQQPVSYSSRLQVIHRPGSGNCDRSRLMQYGCAWLPPGGKKRVFRHGF